MLKQNYILFRKTPQCFFPSIIAIILCASFSIYMFIEDSISRDFNCIDIVEHTNMILGNSIYYYILFLYLSFEYLSIVKKHDVVECISTDTITTLKRETQQLLILSTLNLLLCICVLVICICLCLSSGSLYADFLIYIIKAFFIHIFMVNTCAIIIGVIISYINNSVLAYFMLFFFAVTAIFQSGKFTFSVEDTIGSIQELTNIFCASIYYVPDEATLIPVNTHFMAKPLYITFLLIFIYLILNFVKHKKAFFLISAIPAVLCSFTLLCICSAPYTGSNPGYADGSSDLFADDRELLNPAEETNFYVTSYDMQIDVRKSLTADIYMQVSNTQLSEYSFILCKDFSINYIIDEKNKDLKYNRNGNHLYIYNESGELQTIHIKYVGKSYNICYTGENGAYLPGNFPYYPIAGCGDLFQNGYCQLPKALSSFSVSVSSDFPIYSNLNYTDGSFSGCSNQLSIASGKFWKKQCIENIQFIFPYIGADTDPSRNHYIISQLKKYMNYKLQSNAIDYSLEGKTILIQPIHRNAYMYGSDMVMFDAAGNMDIFYTNYLQTGNWYDINSILTEEELKKIEEETYNELGITNSTN